MINIEKQIFLDLLSTNIILTSKTEYDERIRMNETFKNVSSKLFLGIWLRTIFSYNFDIYDRFHSYKSYCSLISQNKYFFASRNAMNK